MTEPSEPTSPRSAEPSLLRRINVRTILEVIAENGPSTRAELTRITGISPPTMSKLMTQLTEAELLEADPEPVVTNGRPGIRFRFASDSTQVIGITIQARQTIIAHAGLDGVIADGHLQVFDTPDNYDELLQEIEQQIRQIQKQFPQTRFHQIAVALAGLVDAESGRLEISPNIRQLDGKNPAADLQQRLNIPTLSIQEMNALCLGLLRTPQGKGLQNLACLIFVEGLGCGVISDGQLLMGARGYANELGHITVQPNGIPCGCGNTGCLETLSTDWALARDLSTREGRELTIEDVIAEVRAGTLDPYPELDSVIEHLSIAIAASINLYNPEAVFLYGKLIDIQDDVFAKLEKRARARCLAPSSKATQILRTEITRPESTIAAAIQQIYSAMGPALDTRS